jgi:hypothetical protein
MKIIIFKTNIDTENETGELGRYGKLRVGWTIESLQKQRIVCTKALGPFEPPTQCVS